MYVNLNGAGDAAAGRVQQVPRTPASVPKVARRVFAVDNHNGNGGIGLRENAVARGTREMFTCVFTKCRVKRFTRNNK